MKVRQLLVGLGVIFGSTLFATPATAITYQEDTTVRFTFRPELRVRLDTANIEILDLTPGTSSDSNVIGITIDTNNMVGYTATASVGDSTYNTTNMIHTNGTNSFASLGIAASESTISTDNTWGYATSTDNGSSWSNFSGLPIYTDTAKEIAVTNSPASDSLKFKINAKAATSQAAGDYRNVINFTVVANVPPRTIEDAIEQTYPDPPVDPETGKYTLQSLNGEVCDLVEAIGESAILADVRDHTTYHVAKLPDNRCWLQDNLALDIADSTIKANMTEANTNAPNSVLSYLKNGGGTSSDQFAIDPVENWTTENSFSKPLVNSQFKNDITDDSLDIEEGYLTGNYYNYCAASAGSYCYGNGSSYGESYDNPDTAVDAEYDICPVGWRMPTGNSSDNNGGEYVIIYETVPGEHGYPRYEPFRRMLRLPLTGYYEGGSKSYYGVYGYYTSATHYNNYTMRFLDIDVPVNPYSNYKSRAYGLSVRCIVKESSKYTISYNANGGTGMIADQVSRRGETVQLAQNTFTRSGYVFNGWNTKADGNGAGYGDEDPYTITTNEAAKTITLYAQWLQDTGSGSGGGSTVGGRTLQRAFEEAYLYNHGNFDGHKGMYVPEKDAQGNFTGDYHEATSSSEYDGIAARDLRFAMQDIGLLVDGEKICDRTTVYGSEAYVLDLRDNKSYWVTKLKDGKCWMTQNLDLDLSTSKTLYHADTDLGWTTGDSSASWTPDYSTATGSIGSTFNEGWGNRFIPKSFDPGEEYIYTTGRNTVFNSNSACQLAAHVDDQICHHYHVGNYYNWNAAIAMNDTDSDYYKNSYNDAPNSICPAGWRLPHSEREDITAPDGRSEYYTLGLAQGFIYPSTAADYTTCTDDSCAAPRAAPTYFVRAGYGYNGRYEEKTSGTPASFYWHSTADTTVYARDFYMTGENLFGYGYGKEHSDGSNVRCLAR